MNDLPDSSGNPPIGGSIPTATTPVIEPGSPGGENKEIESGRGEVPLRAIGQEVEVSPEVVASGVKVQPTSIPIPPPVKAMGVQPAGQNVIPAAPVVTLPLSDDQIALGLKQSIWSSWRWLAQWCVRRLKQVHMGLRNIHGKLTRVRQ